MGKEGKKERGGQTKKQTLNYRNTENTVMFLPRREEVGRWGKTGEEDEGEHLAC